MQDSTPPQTVTTGTRDSFEGEKQTKERSPRSTLEGPLQSNSTLASAQHLTEAHGMRGSNDWRREYHDDDLGDEDDEEDYEEDLASGAHRGQDSGSGEESNLRRSARNHGTDSRKVSLRGFLFNPILSFGLLEKSRFHCGTSAQEMQTSQQLTCSPQGLQQVFFFCQQCQQVFTHLDNVKGRIARQKWLSAELWAHWLVCSAVQ